MLLSLLLCVLLAGIDQLIKYLVSGLLAPAKSMPLIPGVIGLAYYENDGVAFGMLSGGKSQGLLIVLTVLLLLGSLVYVLRFQRLKGWLQHLTFILIFSGGLGNLIDRIALGYVRDYLDFLFVRFAVFNFADMMVVCGCALLAFIVFRSDLRLRKASRENAEH